MIRAVHVVVMLIGSSVVLAQISPNAPADRPAPLLLEQLKAFADATAPYVAKARETYPAARDRYLSGLPRGETFFVTTRIQDKSGVWEQVFIRVEKIIGRDISGRIANDLHLVRDFRFGQAYTFRDSELIDWVIAKPDGSEEGNVVGKFLDTYRP